MAREDQERRICRRAICLGLARRQRCCEQSSRLHFLGTEAPSAIGRFFVRMQIKGIQNKCQVCQVPFIENRFRCSLHSAFDTVAVPLI